MKLGVSSHTFAWSIGVPGYPSPRTPLDVFGLIRKAAQLNVPVVQIADNLPLHVLPPGTIGELKAFADQHRIQLEVGTAGIRRDHLLAYLEIAKALGSPLVRTLPDCNGHRPSVEDCIVELRAVAKEFENAGVSLAIENHDRFSSRTLAAIIQAVASSRVGICLDTANSLGCGEDVRTVVADLAPFVVNLHIKDFKVSRLPHCKGFVVEGASAGEGRLDVPWLLSTLSGRSELITAIVELWVSPDQDIEQTVEREACWAAESVEYVRRCLQTAF